MPELLNVSQFAARAGCDEKQVRRAIARGLLNRCADGLLDAAQLASNWRRPYRRMRDKAKTVAPDNPDNVDNTDEVVGSETGNRHRSLPGGTYADALLLKEQSLAVMRELEYREKAGELVDVKAATRTLFELGRAARDAWLNWPMRVAPLIAAELDIEPDRVTRLLVHYVHEQVSAMGDTHADFGSPKA